MIRQRQQGLEHLPFRDIGIEDGRDVFRARRLEQCLRACKPTRIGQHRRRGADLFEPQPIGLFRELPAEIDDLPLAVGVDQNSRYR